MPANKNTTIISAAELCEAVSGLETCDMPDAVKFKLAVAALLQRIPEGKTEIEVPDFTIGRMIVYGKRLSVQLLGQIEKSVDQLVVGSRELNEDLARLADRIGKLEESMAEAERGADAVHLRLLPTPSDSIN